MNVKGGAQRYFAEAAGKGQGQTAGQLAQSVQRSAFPARYDQMKPQAKAIVHSFKQNQKDTPQAQKAQAYLASKGVQAPKGQAKPTEPLAPQQITKFQAIKQTAHKLTSAHIPYVWGGGHGSFSNPRGFLYLP